MEYSDIIRLVGAYAGFVAVVFSVTYGACALWRFFRVLSTPDHLDVS